MTLPPEMLTVTRDDQLFGRRHGPWVDDMRMAVSHPPAKFAIEIHFCEIL